MLASRISVIVALTLSSLWMVATYTLAGAVLYASLPAALASTPGLIMEGIVNSIIAFSCCPSCGSSFRGFRMQWERTDFSLWIIGILT